MLKAFLNAFRLPDLRNKATPFTLSLIAIYRFGLYVPVPVVDSGSVADSSQSRRARAVLPSSS